MVGASPRLRVVDLGLVVRVGRRQLSVDGGRDAAAAPLVVVGQRQVEQAGAGWQVDVLHVIHLGATHRAQLEGGRGGGRELRLASLTSLRSLRVVVRDMCFDLDTLWVMDLLRCSSYTLFRFLWRYPR